ERSGLRRQFHLAFGKRSEAGLLSSLRCNRRHATAPATPHTMHATTRIMASPSCQGGGISRRKDSLSPWTQPTCQSSQRPDRLKRLAKTCTSQCAKRRKSPQKSSSSSSSLLTQ